MIDRTYNYNCRLFNGYRPCFPRYVCTGCTEALTFDRMILLINLDAMGDVLMTTCMLESIHRAQPKALLTWVTLPEHLPLLANNPRIDRIWPYDFRTVSILEAIGFDLLLNVDKGRPSCALAMHAIANEKRGFGLNRNGTVIPLNDEAEYLYRLGLDDEEKFVRNRRTGQDLLAEALCLPYQRDGYLLLLTEEEKSYVAEYRRTNSIGPQSVAIGIQTGASDLYPLKCFTEEQIAFMIEQLGSRYPEAKILLLGGPAETERNGRLASRFGHRVLATPTSEGLRRGILYIDACDILISPDTGALHIGIALGKWVVGWFNISCAQEIDLFDRGVKIATPLDCSPCWRRTCPDPICREIAPLDRIIDAVGKGIALKR